MAMHMMVMVMHGDGDGDGDGDGAPPVRCYCCSRLMPSSSVPTHFIRVLAVRVAAASRAG